MKMNFRKSLFSKQSAGKRRIAYSLAAGAAACTAAGQTDAAVVYSGLQNISINPGNSLNLDLDGYLGGDVSLKNYVFGGGNYQGATVNFAPGKLLSFQSGNQYVKSLTVGELISPTTITAANSFFGSMAYGALNPNAQFNTAPNAYLGLSFPAGAFGTLYGWVRVGINNAAGTFTVKDWAYNDVAGAPITAGEGYVPEPGTLGLLAVGAAGVLAMRRRQQAA